MAVSSADSRWAPEVNDRYCDMLGYCRDEALQRSWTDLTHPDDLQQCLVEQNRLLSGEVQFYTMEGFLRKDGSVMFAILFARCIRRPDGSVDHVLALVEDITQAQAGRSRLAAKP